MLPDRAGLLERMGLAAAHLGLVAPKLPLPFYDAYLGLLGARAVMAATRLGIVEALAERPDTVDGLARRLALDPERLDVLLTALVALGYLRRKRDGRCEPTRTARRWLTGDRGVQGFAGPLAYANWEAMLHNFPPSRCVELLTRAHAALRPGGLLAAQELERPPAGRRGSRISGLGALVFTVTMGGRTYTACELRDLARRAGFVDVRVVRPVRLSGCALLLARRA